MPTDDYTPTTDDEAIERIAQQRWDANATSGVPAWADLDEASKVSWRNTFTVQLGVAADAAETLLHELAGLLRPLLNRILRALGDKGDTE